MPIPPLDRQILLDHLGQLRPYMLYVLQMRFNNRFSSLTDRDDLVQDVCIKVIEQLSQFRGDSLPQFRARIRQMLIHSAIDVVRHAKIRTPANPLSDVIDPATFEPIDHILMEEENQDLLWALQQLSESDLTLVLAHYFQGKTLTELSEEFQQNLKTLQKRRERALHRLQDRLNGG